MSYLYPPPEPAPVVVVKDVGGLVSDYRDRTEMYRAQNREVRLHECRSACTLALSLPNVCVYPDAQLKFHQAYNDITKETPACFEPTLDYVVVKAPRFAFEKFPGADGTLTTTMKSVGEAMSLGRNFVEALGKVMRSLETTKLGFWTGPDEDADVDEVLKRLRTPTDGRLYDIEYALRLGASVEQVAEASGVDPWFVDQISGLVELRAEIIDAPVLGEELLRRSKHNGLSDRQIAALRPELAGEVGVRALRRRLGIHPVYKTVDTCAAEFASAAATAASAGSSPVPSSSSPGSCWV